MRALSRWVTTVVKNGGAEIATWKHPGGRTIEVTYDKITGKSSDGWVAP